MALKDTNAVVGETQLPGKYSRIDWLRFGYPQTITACMADFVDAASAGAGGPQIGKTELALDAAYTFTAEEVTTLKAMLDGGATLRDVAATMAYMQIKQDERFADLEDVLE